VQTSLEKSVSNPNGGRHAWKQAGRAAAWVGDEVITLQDLLTAFKDYRKRNQLPPNMSREQINDLAAGVLASLIERSLLVQEAKREIKNPKQLDKFMEMADRVWREDQLPPLQYHYAVDNEHRLRERLAEEGRSLDSMRQAFRQDFLAQGFLHEKLKDRVKVELPDLLRYYQDHVHDREFDRPAQITWHELVVEAGKYPNRDQARRKADALLEKLRRGADLAQLARTESDGPTRSRDQGGLMQTSPGGYAVPAVNAALESLPLRQVSAVLEGPSSFHIIRVENRRPAGPASFEEVQDKIRSRLLDQRFQDERKAFIAKLRQQTLVSSIFDGTESDPSKAAH
jgi:peptidyl-prolyl cis-trans isomerase SurA